MAVKLCALCLVVLATVTVAVADDEQEVAEALAVTLAMVSDDGVASLPVFKGPFPRTNNMTFLGQVSPENLGAQPTPGIASTGFINDLWGWTSPNGEEYALTTHTGGIGIVRITDPTNPEFLGKLQSQDPFNFANIWGDVAIFGNYGYFVTEISGSSLVIVDLSGLDALAPADSPDAALPAPVELVAPGGYRSAHNIRINEASGFAYVAGVRLAEGAANNACGNEDPPRFNTLILDLNANPMNPPVAACLEDVGEHDFHVVNYTGPDADHQGKEIAFVFDGRDREGQASGTPVGGKTLIWDVTDKANIVEIASFRVPGLVFSHNGWTTEQQDYLFIGDELDELVQAGWDFSVFFAQPVAEPTNKPQTGTYIIDIRDLDNPVFAERYADGTVGLDQNFVVKGDKLYLASATSGTRVLHIARDGSGNVGLAPFARMDTEPRLQNNTLNIEQEHRFATSFLGQWGIYAFPSSDTIIASDRNNGLIVMRLGD
jgi:choice-of-anchor B domain-containing protein